MLVQAEHKRKDRRERQKKKELILCFNIDESLAVGYFIVALLQAFYCDNNQTFKSFTFIHYFNNFVIVVFSENQVHENFFQQQKQLFK